MFIFSFLFLITFLLSSDKSEMYRDMNISLWIFLDSSNLVCSSCVKNITHEFPSFHCDGKISNVYKVRWSKDSLIDYEVFKFRIYHTHLFVFLMIVYQYYYHL